MKTCQLYLIINPQKFYYLKNILEGYDGLAIISSNDIKSGSIKIRFQDQSTKLLLALLDSISEQIQHPLYLD